MIHNVDYKEANEALNYAMDDLHSVGWDIACNARRSEDNEEIREMWSNGLKSVYDYSMPSIKKGIRDALKNGVILPLDQEYIDVVATPWIMLKERLQALKPYIQKGRKVDPNAVSNKYSPPRASTESHTKVGEFYESLLVDWYKISVEDWFNHLMSMANNPDILKKTHEMEDKKKAERIGELQSSLYFAIDYDHSTKTRTFKRGWKELIRSHAENVMNSVRVRFIRKNVSKLSSIIDKKGNLKSMELISEPPISGRPNCEIKVLFEDGSEFIVRNKTVVTYNTRRSYNPFHRFPTTFHDIKLADGTFKKIMSEEEMNKEF